MKANVQAMLAFSTRAISSFLALMRPGNGDIDILQLLSVFSFGFIATPDSSFFSLNRQLTTVLTTMSGGRDEPALLKCINALDGMS